MSDPARIISMPVQVREPGSGSPERSALSGHQSTLNAILAEDGRLRAPVERLEAVVGQHTAAEKKLAALREGDRQRLAQWLTKPIGPRPEPDVETLRLEGEIGRLLADKQAAEQALPALRTTLNEHVTKVTRAKLARDHACWSACVAAGRERAGVLRAMLEECAAVEAELHDLDAALQARAARSTDESAPAAGQAAAMIRDIVGRTKGSITMRPAPGVGDKLISRLMAGDATAGLGGESA